MSTNGLSSSTFLPDPTPLVEADTIGGADGSRPCFTCRLQAAGLSAQGFVPDPIDTADGDFYESIPIVSIPGLGPNLSFTATYDSQLAQAEVASGQSSPGSLGWGWSSNASMSLTGAGGTGNVTVAEEGGAEISYTPAATGPGFNGATCASSGTLECYVAQEPDVTAVLEESLGTTDTFEFSRNGGLTTYDFNTSGQLTKISDSNGDTETFAYDQTTQTNCTTSGTACEIETDAEGRTLDIVYTTSTSLVSKVIDPAGRTWSFAYDGNDNLTSITNPRTGVESFGYDTGSANPTMVHNMTSLTEPNGQSGGPDAGKDLAIAYEESTTSATAPLGYVISQTDPAGLTTSFSYSGNNMSGTGTTTITDPHGNVSQDEYETGVLIAQVTGANSSHPEMTSFVRNAQDLPTSVTDANGHTTTYSYDQDGDILTSTDASNNTWTYTYNAFDELLTAITDGIVSAGNHQYL